MHATLPALHILTAPGRDAVLNRALASLRASDWPGEAVIHVDRGAADAEPRLRQIAAWHEMLETATNRSRAREPEDAALRAVIAETSPWRASSDEFRESIEAARRAGGIRKPGGAAMPWTPAQPLLLVGDDVLFHPRIAARLSEWPPFTRGCIRTFASLHHAAMSRDPGGMHGPSWFAAAPGSWGAAHALLVTPSFAAHCLRHWSGFPGVPQGRRLAAIAARDFPTAPVWVHVPSLVEHAADRAAWSTEMARGEPACAAS